MQFAVMNAPTKAIAGHRQMTPLRAIQGQSNASALRVSAPGVAALKASVSRGAAVRARASAAKKMVTSATSIPQDKKVCIITGASSGLGLQAARALAERGDWHVVMACRDWLKADRAAKRVGIPASDYTIMHLELGSFDSVRNFADAFHAAGSKLDAMVCNAAVYFPTTKEASFTAEGFEESVGVNHLGHFLLLNLLMPDLKASDYKRCIIVGSITGNDNTLAGNIPPRADLGDLRGLAAGFTYPNITIDGDNDNFWGPKAYKDSKVCNMLTMRELHRRYHDSTGITFSSLYPGCIATTGLFRNHYQLFRDLFPPFQKYVTKGFVSEEEAGRRLSLVVADNKYTDSGVYWSWDANSEGFQNMPSSEVSDGSKGERLFTISEQLCGVEFPATAKAAV